MTAVESSDQALVRYDHEIAALTKACLRAWLDCRAARMRADWDEVERLQDLADSLSNAADAKQAELEVLIKRLLGPQRQQQRRLRLVRPSTGRGAVHAVEPGLPRSPRPWSC